MKNFTRSILTLFLITFLFNIKNITAQDLIILNDGEFIESKVTEISTYLVKYRLFTQLDGPVRTISKSKISSIRYEDGTKETFAEAPPTTAAAPRPASKPQAKPEKQYSAANTAKQESTPSHRTFIALISSASAPYSFYIGGLNSDLGYYIGFRSNFNTPDETVIYECDYSGVTNPIYDAYEYTGVEKVSRWGITVGLTEPLSTDLLWWYAGIGYGSVKYFHKYDEYYIQSNGNWIFNEEEWAEHSEWAVSGLEAELGMMLDFGGFNINGGVTSINFKNYEFTFGAGFSF